jgi:hypothetical protein
MSGVVTARIPDDDICLLREHVNDLALAFVTPLGADENRVCHKSKLRLHNKNPRT